MLILFISFIYSVFTGILIVVGVAFVTLLERKILGLVQYRLGPNKVGLVGILQPFSDAIKLLSKSSFDMIYASGFKYIIMPVSMFMIMLLLWELMPVFCLINNYSNGGLIVICLMSLGVVPFIWGSWFSLSVYSMIGSLRSVAQMISYEVSLIMILMGFYLYIGGFMLSDFMFVSSFFMLPYLFLVFFSVLMELNRTPSDLVEGESELVSGFNTEFYGLNFSLIFLGEYGSIMFMSGFMSLIFFGFNPLCLMGGVFSLFLIFFIILIRGALPRIRYDFLMYLCWTSIISLSLGYFTMVFGLLTILW